MKMLGMIAVLLSLCLGTAQAQVVGYDSGPKVGFGSVNGSSHAAGVSVGGFFQIPIARINSGSGIITNFQWISPGGSTAALIIRLWNTKPVNTTCTDNANFVSSAADDTQLITNPFSITPAAPSNTQGDSKTYAQETVVTWDYALTGNVIVWGCAVAAGTDTGDESSSPIMILSGPQN